MGEMKKTTVKKPMEIHTQKNSQLLQQTQQMQNQQQIQGNTNNIFETYTNASKQFLEYEEQQKRDVASKWENKEKTAARNKRISFLEEETERKKAFYNPITTMSDAMHEAMDAIVEKKKDALSVKDITHAFYQVSGDNEIGFEPEELIKEKADQSASFLTLCKLFENLTFIGEAGLTTKKAEELLESYKNLNLTREGMASRYLYAQFEQNGERKNIAARDPKSCYLLLYNCITMALRDHVNQMDEKKVNIPLFSKLCGIASASNIALAYLLSNTDFEETHAAEVERAKEEERKKKEKETLTTQTEQQVQKEEQKKEEKKEEKQKESVQNKTNAAPKTGDIASDEKRRKELSDRRLPMLARIIEELPMKAEISKDMIYALTKEYIGENLYLKETKKFAIFINKTREVLAKGMARLGTLLDENKDLYLGKNMNLIKVNACKILLGQMGVDLFQLTEKKKKRFLPR